jgi:hypothetical protein
MKHFYLGIFGVANMQVMNKLKCRVQNLLQAMLSPSQWTHRVGPEPDVT